MINSLNGWEILPVNNETNDALVVIVNPVDMPMYKMYITYQNSRPTSKEIKLLHWELTNENSIVTKAHKLNIPVESHEEYQKI